MRAVNLIPADERRGAGGAAGRSGGAAYLLLGALGLVLALTTLYVISGKSINDKRSQLASVEQQAQAAESQAQGLSAYTKFASLRQKRVQTVTQLANSRFDWAHALHEIARVLPENAWLTQVVGTVAPGVPVGGGTAAASLRSAISAPAVEMSGCTTSQASVAKMLARMRLIDGVQRVSLADSTKGGDAAGGGGGGSDCRGASSHFPMFNLVVFFEATTAASATAGTTATAAATTTAAASSATPSNSATPSSATPSSAQPASGGTTP